jgi:hypothetical protein
MAAFGPPFVRAKEQALRQPFCHGTKEEWRDGTAVEEAQGTGHGRCGEYIILHVWPHVVTMVMLA